MHSSGAPCMMPPGRMSRWSVLCALREVRVENNDLGREVARLRTRTAPEQIVVATSRGERYHLPNCGNVRHSNVKRYSPCLACLGRG